jgi:cell wall-associated NlpC family hydrolase
MWLGLCGVATNGETLIIDSHDNSPPVTNSAGVVIPAGVNIRPFRDGSWYFRCFDHAHRIVDYVTPYQVQYTHPTNDLAFDFNQPPRNDTTAQTALPRASWYTDATRSQVGGWGPHPIQYPAPAGLSSRDVTWLRERVLITARKFAGYDYQHHHIPDWSPTPPNYPNAAEWPWEPVNGYRNSPGFDCSDFTAFAYNYGLGIKMTSDVAWQAALTNTPGPNGRGQITIQTIPRQPYSVLTNLLVTGDLLYIRSTAGSPTISHVIMWVGHCGNSTNGDPLITDSHGNELFDSNGERIPGGVQLRPFQSNSWYYTCFDHANRILTTNLAVAPPLALGALTISGNHPVLVWSNYPGETYFVECSTNLALGFRLIASGLPVATNPVNTFTDTNSTGGSVGFYRIGIDSQFPSPSP